MHEVSSAEPNQVFVPPRPFDPDRARSALEEWRERLATTGQSAVELSSAQSELLIGAFGNSPFLTRCALNEPELTARLTREGSEAATAEILESVAADHEQSISASMRGLRIAKRRMALAIALADLSGEWDVEQVTAALSDFADRAISAAVDALLRPHIAAGTLRVPDASRPSVGSGYVVLGMGKLGARELNYSSDIDLIVLYDPERVNYSGRRHISELFIRLTRDLVKVLQERTEDGYVFRVDLQLRPDAGATPVAIPVGAAESYYESVGQNWERAAMIKARPVAGDLAVGRAFLDHIRPFVWRRHLDFAAIREVHAMTRLIRSHHGFDQIAVPGHNVKLGIGGIRELEFFVQIHQLVAGGRQARLREPTTLGVLDQLAANGVIGRDKAGELRAAYVFLRQLEHRLQMVQDEQTHSVPSNPSELEHTAIFVGFADSERLKAALVPHLQHIAHAYNALLDTAGQAARQAQGLAGLLESGGPDLLDALGELGFTDPDAVLDRVHHWSSGRYPALRSALGRELLERLTPAVLQAFGKSSEPDAALARFDDFLAALPAGVQIFSLFNANPRLLDLLAEILSGAAVLAAELTRKPSLLEAVLQPDFHTLPQDLTPLKADLREMLRAARDFQDVLDITRRWANERKFQVGVQLLMGNADGEAAGKALSLVAEAVLQQLVPAVMAEFVQAHGSLAEGELAILALGKLGAREMTLSSDLDLVIVYQDGGSGASDGARPLGTSEYYARLSKRIINALTALTGEGRLYEVDMQLRPSGNQGPIAVSLTAFEQYHDSHAWTWERMALTRGRVVFGPGGLADQIEAVLHTTIRRPETPAALAQAVREMRQKMAEHNPSDDPWDIKGVRGGLIDLEFMAQFLILRWAHEFPAVITGSTADAFQRLAAAGVVEPKEGEALAAATRLLLGVQHLVRLWGREVFGSGDAAPKGLKRCLHALFATSDPLALHDKLISTEEDVRRQFGRIIGTELLDSRMAEQG